MHGSVLTPENGRCPASPAILLIAVASLAAAGCGRDSAEPETTATTVVDTLETGDVIVRNLGTDWGAERRWRLEEMLRLDAEFGAVSDVEIDALGRIYVADSQAGEVLVFGEDGQMLRTIGRRGAGPGEFEAPMALQWRTPTELWIVDADLNRYTIVDTTGTLLTTRDRPVFGAGLAWNGRFASESRLFDVAMDLGPDGLAEEVAEIGIDSAELRVLRRLDVPAGRPWLAESRTVDRDGGLSVTAVPIPFAPRTRWQVGPSGEVWYTDASSYRFRRLSWDSERELIVEKEYQPVPVTPAELEAEIAELTREWGGAAGPPEAEIPVTKPAIRNLFVDDDGNVWVAPTVPAADGGPTRYDVFSPEGHYLVSAAADLDPDGPAPKLRNGILVGVRTDSLGVATVVKLRLAQ